MIHQRSRQRAPLEELPRRIASQLSKLNINLSQIGSTRDLLLTQQEGNDIPVYDDKVN
jgi:hypothetical protein